MTEEKEEPKKRSKAKPELANDILFEYREISIPLYMLETRESVDYYFKGKVLKTCLNMAWEAAAKERKKYA